MKQTYPQTDPNFFYNPPTDASPLYLLKNEISRGDLEPQGPKQYVEVPDLPEEYGLDKLDQFKDLEDIFNESIKQIESCYSDSLQKLHKTYMQKVKKL